MSTTDLKIEKIRKLWANNELKEYEDESVIECLKENNICLFNIIYTFESREQQFVNLAIQDTKDEKSFLTQIFNTLKLEEVKDLVKISTCQYYCSKEEGRQEYLKSRRGKFYFNVDFNYDDGTKMLNEFRNTYCKSRKE